MNPQVHLLGINELRSALRSMDKGLAREVTKALKEGAKVAQPIAARLEPRGVTGRLAGSVKAGAAGAKAYLKSSLIYAGPHEFGGQVGRNHSVHIRKTSAMHRGVDESLPEIIDTIGDGLDDLAQRNGF